MVWVVDAHTEYQAGLNVPRLAGEGYSALTVKATQGATGYTAPGKFDTWRRQAQDTGLMFGAYHWLTSADPERQVHHFLDRIGDPRGMLIQLDVEDNANPPGWNHLAVWDAVWRSLTGNHPYLIYTGAWWWNAAGRRWNGSQLTPYLWHSQYVMDGSRPAAGYASSVYSRVPASWWTPGYGGWGRATMLQFTSRGTAGGITANVDVNYFDGGLDQLRALTGAPQPREDQQDMDDNQARELHNVEHWITVGGDQAAEGNFTGTAEVSYDNAGDTKHQVPTLPNIAYQAARKALQDTPQPVSVELTDPEVVHAIAVEVAGLLAPQFRRLDQLADKLGSAGDALGTLNDPS